MPLLHAQKVTKRFGGLTALKDVEISIDQGQIFGLIGPNGATIGGLISRRAS